MEYTEQKNKWHNNEWVNIEKNSTETQLFSYPFDIQVFRFSDWQESFSDMVHENKATRRRMNGLTNVAPLR